MQRRVGRLPDHHVAEQSRWTNKGSSQRRKVERCNGVDEALQRSILHLVPLPGEMDLGLLREQRPRLLDVVSEEVHGLCRGINLRLPDVFALAQHRGGIEILPVLSGNELRRAEEDGRAVFE